MGPRGGRTRAGVRHALTQKGVLAQPRRTRLILSGDFWLRALLIASLRDERSDPFAASDTQLLRELGLWPASLRPFRAR